MLANKLLRKSLNISFTVGTTVSIGILSAIGIAGITSSLFISVMASVLAMVFEAQVNGEGIANTLKRMFTRDYLKLAIIENFLDDLMEDEGELPHVIQARWNNEFYKNYRPQKEYVDYLKNEIANLTFQRDSLIPIYDAKERKALLEIIRLKKRELKQEKKDLYSMKLFFLKKLYQPASSNTLEKAVNDLIGQRANALKKEISRKANAIRGSWIFSVLNGVCSGLSTLSALKAGVITFTALSFIPGGVVISLSVMAAIGYAFLIQDVMAKVIQKYKKGWLEYAKKRNDESTLMHNVRRVILGGAILLAFAATYATAGTWFSLVQEGNKILGAVDKVANVLRDIFIAGMVLPNLVYNTENSLESINKISKMGFKNMCVSTLRSVVTAFRQENFIRFLNPFRILEKTISLLCKSALFLGHAASIGASASIPMLSSAASVPIVGSNELVTDGNYLPDKNSGRKHSIFLTALFFPPNALATGLKVFSVGWDYIFSSPRNLKMSFEKMVKSPHLIDEPLHATKMTKPTVTEDWNRQTIIETCEQTLDRLTHENWFKKKLMINKTKTLTKIEDIKTIKTEVISGKALQKKAPQYYLAKLSQNRSTLWHETVTQSEADLTQSFKQYFKRSYRRG